MIQSVQDGLEVYKNKLQEIANLLSGHDLRVLRFSDNSRKIIPFCYLLSNLVNRTLPLIEEVLRLSINEREKIRKEVLTKQEMGVVEKIEHLSCDEVEFLLNEELKKKIEDL